MFKGGFWVNIVLTPESESVPRAVYGLIWPLLQKVKVFKGGFWVDMALAPESECVQG